MKILKVKLLNSTQVKKELYEKLKMRIIYSLLLVASFSGLPIFQWGVQPPFVQPTAHSFSTCAQSENTLKHT